MKSNINAMYRPCGVGLACQIPRTADNDKILDRVAQRLLRLMKVRSTERTQNIQATDHWCDRLDFRADASGPTPRSFSFTSVLYDLSQTGAAVVFISSRDQQEGKVLSVYDLSPSGLSGWVLEAPEATAISADSCTWCTGPMAMKADGSGQFCTVCESDHMQTADEAATVSA